MDMRENIDILFAVGRFQMSLNPYMKDSVFYVEESAYHEVTVSWSLSFRINKNPFD